MLPCAWMTSDGGIRAVRRCSSITKRSGILGFQHSAVVPRALLPSTIRSTLYSGTPARSVMLAFWKSRSFAFRARSFTGVFLNTWFEKRARAAVGLAPVPEVSQTPPNNSERLK